MAKMLSAFANSSIFIGLSTRSLSIYPDPPLSYHLKQTVINKKPAEAGFCVERFRLNV